jgi:glucose-6-phosphate isomerase
MTSAAFWNKYCSQLRMFPETGISLDLSCMSIAPLSSLGDRMNRAFHDMQALEKGAIANPDEQRMVGHYWLRTPELAPSSEIRNAITHTKSSILEFARAVHSRQIKPPTAECFRNIFHIGIGGSALGPQLVADALWSPSNKMHIVFSDNTDPDGITRALLELGAGLKETLVVVVSKSGGTVETQNGMLEVMAAYKQAGLHFPSYAVAVTGQGSKLDKLAQTEQWLKRFEMWDWVGGRTSLFSAVGLLPAALLGIDIESFIQGAAAMDCLTRQQQAEANPAALLALSWYLVGEGKGAKDMVVIPYKDRLLLFSRYLQQLIMESLGKEHDLEGRIVNQGIAVYGNKGSTDQHAYVQQLRDGLDNFFVTFIEVLGDYFPGLQPAKPLEVKPGITSGDYLFGFLQGTRQALYEKGRNSLTITVDEISPRSLGALIALYERAVGFYAFLVGVNAYHQPGVEAGKKAAQRVIDLQQKLLSRVFTNQPQSKSYSVQELTELAGGNEETVMVYKIMEHLAANPARGFIREGERSPDKVRYRKG